MGKDPEMNQAGVSKIAIVAAILVVLLLVAGGIVKFVVLSPDNVALGLYQQADVLIQEADAAFAKGDAETAKEKFAMAQSKTDSVLEKYKETLSAEQSALLGMKCKRRIASLDSPKGAVESMIKAIGVPKSDEYLEYWDFMGVAEEVMREDWASINQSQKDRLATFCQEGTQKLVDQTRDMINLVKVTYLKEDIQGDRSTVSTEWEAMQRKLEVPFKTRKPSSVWKVVDFEVSAIGGGPASFLREALDRCTKDVGLAAFLGASDFEQKLEESYLALLEEKQQSIQVGGGGEEEKTTWVLSKDTEIKQQDQVLASLPAGTVVEVLQEAAETAGSGKMTMISCSSQGGAPVVGWVPAENVQKKASAAPALPAGLPKLPGS